VTEDLLCEDLLCEDLGKVLHSLLGAGRPNVNACQRVCKVSAQRASLPQSHLSFENLCLHIPGACPRLHCRLLTLCPAAY